MDLLRQARALGLLRLDDAHLNVLGCRGGARVRDEAAVAALEEQPRVLEAALGEVQPRELRPVEFDLGGQQFHLSPKTTKAAVVLAALEGIELTAERLPAFLFGVVGLSISLGDGPKAVGRVSKRRLGLGVEAVEVAVATFDAGTCEFH